MMLMSVPASTFLCCSTPVPILMPPIWLADSTNNQCITVAPWNVREGSPMISYIVVFALLISQHQFGSFFQFWFILCWCEPCRRKLHPVIPNHNLHLCPLMSLHQSLHVQAQQLHHLCESWEAPTVASHAQKFLASVKLDLSPRIVAQCWWLCEPCINSNVLKCKRGPEGPSCRC